MSDDPNYRAVVDESTFSIKSTIHVTGQIGDWVIYAGVLPDDRYAISEIRVFPAEETFGPGDTRVRNMENEHGEWSGRPDLVPHGGIPFRLLRSIRERDIQNVARAWMEETGKFLADVGERHFAYERIADRAAKNEAIDKAREDYVPLPPVQRLALLAKEYVDLLDTEDAYRPNEVLAERYGKSAGWVSTELYRARNNYKLLTKTKRGLPGGSLTDRAKKILEQLEANTDTKDPS